MRRLAPLGLLAIGLATPAFADDGLHPPVKLEANGKPIDVAVGHAAPFVTDWDGDGKADLLVGQFGGGMLNIFLRTARPEGALPVLGSGAVFQAQGEKATIPSG
jgi:hypothetical protein